MASSEQTDPTYVTAAIAANPVWALAFHMSEVDNDHAPIGWSRYIPLARWLFATFEVGPIDPAWQTFDNPPPKDKRLKLKPPAWVTSRYPWVISAEPTHWMLDEGD